jgi:lipopolysaccharide export system permease protein
VDVDENNIANTNTMLTINELNYTLDSLHKENEIVSYSENILNWNDNNIIPKTAVEKKTTSSRYFISVILINKIEN